jgi:hypothetical protein
MKKTETPNINSEIHSLKCELRRVTALADYYAKEHNRVVEEAAKARKQHSATIVQLADEAARMHGLAVERSRADTLMACFDRLVAQR